MVNFDQALAWMRANQDLSGWAQAIGAVVAILIAIVIPAYQRHTQTLDARRLEAGLNLALATSCRFLLNDVIIFFKALLGTAPMPRSSRRDDVQMSDLLERIRALESRETNHARILALYEARGSLILTNR